MQSINWQNVDLKRFYFYSTVLNLPVLFTFYPFRFIKTSMQSQKVSQRNYAGMHYNTLSVLCVLHTLRTAPLQNRGNAAYNGAISGLRHVIKTEGPLAVFKGVRWKRFTFNSGVIHRHWHVWCWGCVNQVGVVQHIRIP
jgi:hypothetical protein